MKMNKDFWKTPWLSQSEKVQLHILRLSCIRFVVEKYEGIMEIDPQIRRASIKIPKNRRAACLQELETLDLIRVAPVETELAALSV